MGKRRDQESLLVDPPDALPDIHVICKVVQLCGNNLYSVSMPPSQPQSEELPASTDERTVLVELPPRFRNTLWIRRGGFVVVDLGALNDARENKLAGSISAVIHDERPWRKMPYWPWPASAAAQKNSTISQRETFVAGPNEDSDEDDLLQANPNRRQYDSESD
ncbi:hypothetical protein PYCC9005_005911 [Savitreella phatthalungensis]